MGRSESTDDIDIETDMCLLMADFTPVRRTGGKQEKVTKVYAVCPINESEIDAKPTRYIAGEGLKMDYSRLLEARPGSNLMKSILSPSSKRRPMLPHGDQKAGGTGR